MFYCYIALALGYLWISEQSLQVTNKTGCDLKKIQLHGAMWAQKPCRKPLNCYNTENQCVCVYMCCCLCPLCVCMGLQGKDALTTSACLVKSKKSEWDFQIRFLPKDYDCPVRFSKHSENVQQCVLGTSVSWREKNPTQTSLKAFYLYCLFIFFVEGHTCHSSRWLGIILHCELNQECSISQENKSFIWSVISVVSDSCVLPS